MYMSRVLLLFPYEVVYKRSSPHSHHQFLCLTSSQLEGRVAWEDVCIGRRGRGEIKE